MSNTLAFVENLHSFSDQEDMCFVALDIKWDTFGVKWFIALEIQSIDMIQGCNSRLLIVYIMVNSSIRTKQNALIV